MRGIASDVLHAGWWALLYIPADFDLDLEAVVRTLPDVGLFMVPTLMLTAAWSAARSALLFRAGDEALKSFP